MMFFAVEISSFPSIDGFGFAPFFGASPAAVVFFSFFFGGFSVWDFNRWHGEIL